MGTVDTVFSVVLDYEDNGYSGHRSLALCGQWTQCSVLSWTMRTVDTVFSVVLDYLESGHSVQRTPGLWGQWTQCSA